MLSFTTTLQPRGPAAAVVLDDAINAYTWRGSVARMGGEYLGRAQQGGADRRRSAGRRRGARRLSAALAGDAKAKAGFDGLSYTHPKEYVRWIAESKKQETRDLRLDKALELLREGKPPR